MSTSRREALLRMLALPFTGTSTSGTAVVIRLKDHKILHIESPQFAAQALLPPASTIKPFTLLALIDLGRLRADDTFVCPGHLTIAGHSLNCVHPDIGLPMTPARAIAYSCNAAVAHFALRFHTGELSLALQRYGFSSPTALSAIPEATGRIERNTTGSACQLQALGEQGIAITPLELLAAYARLTRRLAEPSCLPIREGLEGAVQYGTAQAAQVPGVQVAGKTGSILLQSGSPAAWFAGFAPSRNPKLAVVVLTAGRSGGLDAAPIAPRLLKRYLRA